MKKLFRTIAKVKLEFQIDDRFENILNFIELFDRSFSNAKTEGLIKINWAKTRTVKISEDFEELVIQGSDIDNLNNSFNTIGILQAIFRFVGTKSPRKGIYLLHGSCALFNGKAIFFGDDGTSTAKTLASIECALDSKKYVGDEFCFYNIKNNTIFSYDFIPIHTSGDALSSIFLKSIILKS